MSEKIDLNFSVYLVSKLTDAKYLLARFRWLSDAEFFQSAYYDSLTEIERKCGYLIVEIEGSFNE